MERSKEIRDRFWVNPFEFTFRKISIIIFQFFEHGVSFPPFQRNNTLGHTRVNHSKWNL